MLNKFEIAHLVYPTTLTMKTGLDNIVCTYEKYGGMAKCPPARLEASEQTTSASGVENRRCLELSSKAGRFERSRFENLIK